MGRVQHDPAAALEPRRSKTPRAPLDSVDRGSRLGDPACSVPQGLGNNRTASGDSEPDHAAAGQGLFVLAVAGPGFEPGQAKPTEADILIPLAVIYAYVGRFADARDAIARAWSVHDRSGAKSRWPLGIGLAGHIEQIAGDPPAAGHHLQEAHKALRTIGEQGFLSTVAGMLAEALYVQGRLDEARQITGETRAAAAPDDVDAQTRWRAARAKILARGGQFPAARALLDEAAALVSPTS